MIGGAWTDTEKTHRPKKTRAKQPLAESTRGILEDGDNPTQHDANFRTAVDVAELQLKLRRWTFARSWKLASSAVQCDEPPLSPRSLPKDTENPATSPNKSPIHVDHAEKNSLEEVVLPRHPPAGNTKSTAPLDRHLMAQYLDQCIAAAESQIAGARDKVEKRRAVKEIERLVERVVTHAGLGE